MTAWDFQTALSYRLLRWIGLSVLAGVLLLIVGDPFWRGFGIQALAWGAIDAVIALSARWASYRRRTSFADSVTIEILEREAHRLRRILWVNTALFALCAAGGLVLVLTLGAANPLWQGHSWGIVAQGGFLFLFHLLHARGVPKPSPKLWTNFQGPEVQTFLWENGTPAALLVHGFPGTPAELRPLGQVLQRAGWTVQGLLLPGFGPQVATLGGRRWEEWREAIAQALAKLRRRHAPVLLVGYSLGGALSLSAAAEQPPDGLVLIAPFLWRETWWQKALAVVLGPLLPPYFRPLRWIDFTDPQFRGGMQALFPQVDLEDPAAQSEVRQVAIPLTLLDQIWRTIRHGYEKAATTSIPVVVLQGVRDELIRPERTKQVLRRFPRKPGYVEVEAGHDILDPTNPAWPDVKSAVSTFASSLLKD